MPNKITIRGVRVHDLKNIDVEIPRDQLVVVTGLSGSGKSSLAFDTIYAEGHRRFVESLSSYARMFLGQLDKPDIDSIEVGCHCLLRKAILRTLQTLCINMGILQCPRTHLLQMSRIHG